jgi:hypothetical protein
VQGECVPQAQVVDQDPPHVHLISDSLSEWYSQHTAAASLVDKRHKAVHGIVVASMCSAQV